MDDVLLSGYHKSTLVYDNVDWFVNGVIKLDNKIGFDFKSTKKNIIMTKEDEVDYMNKNIRIFCENEIFSDKVRDHSHLIGKYRSPAHSNCNTIVTQKQSNFIPYEFQNSGDYDCHLIFEKLVDKKTDRVIFDIFP